MNLKHLSLYQHHHHFSFLRTSLLHSLDGLELCSQYTPIHIALYFACVFVYVGQDWCWVPFLITFPLFFLIFIFWDSAFSMTLELINLAKLTDSPKDPLALLSSTGITGMYYYTKLFLYWVLGPELIIIRSSCMQSKYFTD